ncbi:MAG TPA: MBL fold metallo-hydrolase, partial [Candidatus Sulfotelmatobacter sp.]|nr:MBL fold metallo-hydrolase [Candidatus Sulfotelmatobacter sp.]
TLDLSPLPPRVHHEPLRIADDVFLVRQLEGEGTKPMAVFCNTLVIAGKEPVIVDTGGINNRKQWLEDVFSIVEPKAVRWVFISHDDQDHLGNVDAVLRECPNATLVVDWLTVQRTAHEYRLPLARMRWINAGDHFTVGERSLVALRPPTYDSPTTRGLFDTKSRVYWSSDSFGALVPHHVDHASDLPLDGFKQGLAGFNRMMAPWVGVADQRKFADSVQAVRALDASCIASCHGPAIGSDELDTACSVMEQLPTVPPVTLPGQEQLEAMLTAMTHGEAAHTGAAGSR